MKLGQPQKKEWLCSGELNKDFTRLSKTLNRLMILEHVWTRLVGDKGRFWELKGVQSDTLYIQVKVAVAKNELIARQRQLIREINKHFNTPWIKKIEINKPWTYDSKNF
jgi:hypothetical protein